MKTLMMRSLLLFAALGYFLASLHTPHHHHHVPYAAQQQSAQPHPHGDVPATEGDDCPICTVHAFAVATLPPLETAGELPRPVDEAPLAHRIGVHTSTRAGTFGARAPPIC